MLTFSDNKAGMTGLNKEKITKVISENTSGNYSNFSEKKTQKVEEKIREIKMILENSTVSERRRAELKMENLKNVLENKRDLTRHCVCIDMDAYFAAVEMRDDPKLREVPMAVGGQSMLSTSNYIARKFGVRAGIPGFIGKKLCPNLVLVPVNYEKYTKISRQFSSIFAEYDEDCSMMSLDEAYIDITEIMEERKTKNILPRHRYAGECTCWLPLIKNEEIEIFDGKIIEESCLKCEKVRRTYKDFVEFGTGRSEIVREMRFRVEQVTGLTCSAGIASNFMLAKICSDFNKPDGQYELENDREKILEFLENLSIRKVGGIGRVCEAHLNACGITTVGEMLDKVSIFPLIFSELSQESFLRIALGLPGRPSSSDHSKRKSISVERTFTPTSQFDQICNIHREICTMLQEDVERTEMIGGKTITLKLKLATFDVLTRSLTPGKDIIISSFDDIFKYSMELLEREKGQAIRLLGVRLSQLVFKDDEDGGPKRNVKTITDFWNESKNRKPAEIIDDGEYDGEILDTVPCPICRKQIENQMEILNMHVDECIRKRCENDEDVPELICISVEVPKKREAVGKIQKIATSRKCSAKKRKLVTMDMFMKKKPVK